LLHDQVFLHHRLERLLEAGQIIGAEPTRKGPGADRSAKPFHLRLISRRYAEPQAALTRSPASRQKVPRRLFVVEVAFVLRNTQCSTCSRVALGSREALVASDSISRIAWLVKSSRFGRHRDKAAPDHRQDAWRRRTRRSGKPPSRPELESQFRRRHFGVMREPEEMLAELVATVGEVGVGPENELAVGKIILGLGVAALGKVGGMQIARRLRNDRGAARRHDRQRPGRDGQMILANVSQQMRDADHFVFQQGDP